MTIDEATPVPAAPPFRPREWKRAFRALRALLLGPRGPGVAAIGDLRRREIVALAPLAALMVGLGVAPDALLRLVRATIAQIASGY